MVAVPPPELLQPPEKPRPQTSADPSGTASQEQVQRMIDNAVRRVRNAPENGKHYVLRDNARLLGGIADQAGLRDEYLIWLLLDALPSSVTDWNAARDTAEWGLAIGRESPIEIPSERQTDPRRSAIAKAAFRLLRAGIAGADIIAALDEQNAARPNPLPPDAIRDTARWAASQMRAAVHA
jgi:hypothetical protein